MLVAAPTQTTPIISLKRSTSTKSWDYDGRPNIPSDPIEQPSRQEHFGMTIVEAMSAGAVPIVFRGGGPMEIIRPGFEGFLWSDLPELKRLTAGLINGRSLFGFFDRRRQLSSRAVKRSRQFTVDAFLRAMDCIVQSAGA